MADKQLTGKDWAVGCGCLTAIVVAIGIAVTVFSSSDGGSTSTPPPTASDTATGGTQIYLPRLHNETGIAALTAYCRDMWFTQHGSSVGVDVTFTGPGNVTVDVLPKPGDGTGQQTKEYTVGSTESGHHFAFTGVAGQVDHVQVTVTAARGVDQCYARRR